ncbi:uncharacterized protein KD926_000943 [Aspergillus affinis]|uniref:uncharacterized protein n=1 Tax=Aspergillus affinis TaxID=1070780 RepID=UPI0022FDED85|nr:uncharacterized protein KD926_000943 [Aspergillus affinis]KAI9044342.1 hypothetical protein KD926_000943 [Aspergillus affinis]
MASSMKGIRSAQEKRFFDHFVNVTYRTLTLPPKYDGPTILSEIVSMCSEDTTVLKTVLCLGASHLINHLASNATEDRTLVAEKNRLRQEAERELSSRAATLHSLGSRTTQHQTQYQPLLTSYLLLYLFEVSESTGNGAWQTRLDEARDIISNALKEDRGLSGVRGETFDKDKDILKVSSDDDLAIAEPLLQFFIYHDAIGRLIISGIIQAVSIWQDIGKWEPLETDSEVSSGYCTMCDLYVVACFIWLYFMLHPDTSDDEKVQTMVRRGLESLSSIEEPELQSFALFPVFIIGVACTRQEDREQIEEELDIIEQTRRFGNIRVCRRIIQTSWTAYNQGDKHSWDWIRLLETGGMSVPLG